MKQFVTTFDTLVWLAEIGADEVIGSTPCLDQWANGLSNEQKERAPTLAARPLATQNQARVASKKVLPPSLGHHIKTSTPPKIIEAESLPTLRTELEAFDGCPLKTTAMNLVFGEGPTLPKLMIIGDAPSEDDDRQGKPFMGQAGILLEQILAAIGMKREDVYLSSLLFWRPPGNRTATNEEIAACLPFLERQIAIVQPKALFVLGSTPSKHLLRTKDPFSRIRGRWQRYAPPFGQSQSLEIPCLPLYHPGYLLRQPSMKRLLWSDLLNFMNEKDSIFL